MLPKELMSAGVIQSHYFGNCIRIFNQAGPLGVFDRLNCINKCLFKVANLFPDFPWRWQLAYDLLLHFRIHFLHFLNAFWVSRQETINSLPSNSLAESANPPLPNSRRKQLLVVFLLFYSNELNPNLQNVSPLFSAIDAEIRNSRLVARILFCYQQTRKTHLQILQVFPSQSVRRMRIIIMTGLSLQFMCCATVISLFILIEANHNSV